MDTFSFTCWRIREGEAATIDDLHTTITPDTVMDQVFPPLEQRNLHGLNETCGQRPVCIIIFQMLTEPFQLEDRDTPELDNFFPISTR